MKVACGSLHLPRRKYAALPFVREDLRASAGVSKNLLASVLRNKEYSSIKNEAETGPWKKEIRRSRRAQPEEAGNLLHGKPAGWK
ncbi:MAG: hypothetical protein EA344_06575 [Alkalicoccus sp.]|nr:MAG: hypothetical protein EA344_06575 [Alkalicoccus sp.]